MKDTRQSPFKPPARGNTRGRPAPTQSPQKAERIRLRPEMAVGEAFLVSVEASLLHLSANKAPTLDGHPEGIHQSRVAMRRQRAALRAFKSALPDAGRKAFNDEFRWFQKKLGPARDWHVFLDETTPQMVRDGVDESLVEKLRRLAHTERSRASRDAAECLKSRRFSRLLLQYQDWVEGLPELDPVGKLSKELAPFARSVLEKTHRDLLGDTRTLAQMSVEDLHALRIRGKNARYTGELFHAVFSPEQAAPQLALLSRFQDRLGETNDARVAQLILETLKPRQLSAQTIRAVNEWSGKRILACARRAQPEWRRLRGLEPFWRTPVNDR